MGWDAWSQLYATKTTGMAVLAYPFDDSMKDSGDTS
jgi:hypothetical protein